MANEVVVKFVGDASNLNAVADKAEQRVEQVNAKAIESNKALKAEMFASRDAYRAAQYEQDKAVEGTLAWAREQAKLGAVIKFTTNGVVEQTVATVANTAIVDKSTESAAANALATKLQTAAIEAQEIALAGSVLAIGVLAAAGVAIIAVSEQYRHEADLALAAQEKITFGFNKEALAVRQAADDLDRYIQLKRQDQVLSDRIASDVARGSNTGTLVNGVSNVTPGGVADLQQLRSKAIQTAQDKGTELARLQSELERSERVLKSIESQKATSGIRESVNFGLAGLAGQAGLQGLASMFSAPTMTEAKKAEQANAATSTVENLKRAVKETSDELARSKKQLDEADKGLQQIGDNYSKTASDRFNHQVEDLRKYNERLQQEIAEGIKKVQELTKQYKGAFENVVAGSGDGNPFVSIYSNGEKSLAAFRESTRGLTKELRDQGEQLIRNKVGIDAFKTRVDGAFEALDLRDGAQRFRTEKAKETKDHLENRVNEEFSIATRRGRFFGLNDVDPAQFDAKARADIAGRFAAGTLSSNIVGNRDGVALAAYRSFNPIDDDKNLTAQARLDRQLKLADTFKATTDTKDKQADIDAKIVSVSRGIDPTTLRQDQRDKVAAALERQADRTEQREEKSFKIRQDMLEFTKKIEANQRALLGKAVNGGINAVNNTLRIVDETNGGVDISQNPSNPTQADTQKQYHFDGFGLIGGSNR